MAERHKKVHKRNGLPSLAQQGRLHPLQTVSFKVLGSKASMNDNSVAILPFFLVVSSGTDAAFECLNSFALASM